MRGRESAGRRAADLAASLNEARALQTDRGLRDKRENFFIEGVRNFIRVVDHGFTIERILFSERLLTAPLARKLVRRCRRSGVASHNLTPEQFRHLSRTKRASGVAAIVRQKWVDLEDISAGQGICWVLLETVRSPGNLGTLIRSSQAVGGAGFILIGSNVDPFAPDVIRSAMGALYQQAFVRTDWAALRSWIEVRGCNVIGASPDGVADLHTFSYPKGPLLFLGEERRGLTARQRQLCSSFVRIPMQENVDSLNLGVAGSLLMYEVYRNRASPGESVTGVRPGVS